MIKKLATGIGEYKRPSLLAALFVTLEVGLEVVIPYLMSFIVDRGIRPGNTDNVIIYGCIMIACAMVSLFFGVLSARFAAKASAGFAKNIRSRVFGKVQDFSFYNVDKFSTGSLITRLTTDINFIQMAYMLLIRVAVRAPLMFTVGVIMAMTLNARLALTFVAVVPVLTVAMFILIRFGFPLFERMFKKFDAMNNRVQENLVAIRVVKSFVRESHETAEFRKASSAVQRAQLKAEKVVVFGLPLFMFCMYGCLLAILWFGGKFVISDTMSEGQLSSFIAYVQQILMSIMLIAMILINLVISRASGKRIVEVLDEEPDIADTDADPEKRVRDGSVEFREVSFSYSKSDNYVLNGISFKINAGETVGIIGGTGSAKTSLVQLIPRLYDVQKGEVLVGGASVKSYTLKNLRDAVAMVLQKNVLFTGTIRENLQWGDENATEAEIAAACEIAQADEFIRSFPSGYDTDLGQGGVNVSGGQKQRLCIARALLKKPRIMILDDSTSAVDTATDAKIREGMRKKLSNTTVIIIAQRINSVKEADKIIVLNNGKIDAIGTHQELLAANSIYREVYHSQQKGGE
ncbi:MAG: ABC transporter ATP-binding protein [Clostridia bacterium]|nr:ABC transporter ATP-binding protein [Clostridia bacterium]